MKLSTLQQQFQQDFNTQTQHFSEHIVAMGQLSSQARQNVYCDSITACLARALAEHYPVCKKLVGDDFFTAMAYEYVVQTPSRSPNLLDYGEAFPVFVAQFKPAEALVYLADVCRLEWAYGSAYYAAPSLPATAEQLAKYDPEQLILTLPAASTLLASPYPIDKIWQVNQDGQQPDAVIDLDGTKVWLMVHRQAMHVVIQPLPQDLWRLLQALQQDKAFVAVCEQLVDTVDVVALLPLAIQQKLVCVGF